MGKTYSFEFEDGDIASAMSLFEIDGDIAHLETARDILERRKENLEDKLIDWHRRLEDLYRHREQIYHDIHDINDVLGSLEAIEQLNGAAANLQDRARELGDGDDNVDRQSGSVTEVV